MKLRNTMNSTNIPTNKSEHTTIIYVLDVKTLINAAKYWLCNSIFMKFAETLLHESLNCFTMLLISSNQNHEVIMRIQYWSLTYIDQNVES